MNNKDQLTLIGAGLTGALTAIYLARQNLHVAIYEQRGDIREEEYTGGRSINLALSYRGLKALKELGLNSILDKAVGMKGRLIHDRKGEKYFIPYGKNRTDLLYSVSRGELNKMLLNQCSHYPQLKFHFNHKAESVDFENKKITFNHLGKNHQVHYQRLFGTDGSSSCIRKDFFKFLNLKKGFENFSIENNEEDLGYAYKELTIPAGTHGSFQMEKEALHIWPRKSFMLIALPNFDGHYTCTLFLPKKLDLSICPYAFSELKTPTELEDFFRKEFPDTLQLIPKLKEEFFQNPTGHLGTLRTYPWSYGEEVLFFGDASHAIVPFYGQGMDACFEDCSLLNRIFTEQKNHSPSWSKIFATFQEQRKRETDAIAQMALDNFIEMRDKTADSYFHLFKKIEQHLMKLFPGEFFSQYFLVTFTDTPYSYARSIGKKNEEILGEFIKQLPITKDDLESFPVNNLSKEEMLIPMKKINAWKKSQFPEDFFDELKKFL